MPKVKSERASRKPSQTKIVDEKNHSVRSAVKDLPLKPKDISKKKENTENGIETFEVSFNHKSIIYEKRGIGKESILFTHGAGGGIDNPATRDFGRGFAEEQALVAFQGTMNLQSRVQTFHTMIKYQNGVESLGGRSMGARAAVVAGTQSELEIEKLVLVSYPLVGGKNQDLRDQILYDLTPKHLVLFIIGSEDHMCPLHTLEKTIQKMSAKVWLVIVKGADHGMSLKKKDAVEGLRLETGRLSARWVKDEASLERRSTLRWNEHTRSGVLEETKS